MPRNGRLTRSNVVASARASPRDDDDNDAIIVDTQRVERNNSLYVPARSAPADTRGLTPMPMVSSVRNSAPSEDEDEGLSDEEFDASENNETFRHEFSGRSLPDPIADEDLIMFPQVNGAARGTHASDAHQSSDPLSHRIGSNEPDEASLRESVLSFW
jgi:hypothetical protein